MLAGVYHEQSKKHANRCEVMAAFYFSNELTNKL
jgi:hypothetical protein